jgi:hypothetical protein
MNEAEKWESCLFLDSRKHRTQGLFRPFAVPAIGGVITAQRGLDPKTIPKRIGNWLESAL